MKTYLDKDGLLYLIGLIQKDLDTKINIADIVNDLVSEDIDKPLSAKQGKDLNDRLSAYPATGDVMQKSTYDSDGDGKVDQAKAAETATSADSATHATNADNATKAEEATHATSADSAKEATKATTATNAEQLGGITADKYIHIGEDGKVPSEKLPSFVDDVVEGYYDVESGKFYNEPEHSSEITGETGKIYVDLTTENEPVSYRYSGSVYIAIVSSDMVAIANQEIDTLWSA